MNNDSNTTTDTAQNPILDLIDEMGLDLLSEQEQEEFLGDISDALFETVLLKAMMQLSDADRDALSTLIERASSAEDNDAHQEAVLAFLKLKIPNLDDMVRAEAQDLKANFDTLKQEVATSA